MNLPKSIAKLAEKNPEKIAEAFTEEDGGTSLTSDWSIWVYLRRGWINTATETHMIHEATARDVLKMWKAVKPCNCADCESGFIAK